MNAPLHTAVTEARRVHAIMRDRVAQTAGNHAEHEAEKAQAERLARRWRQIIFILGGATRDPGPGILPGDAPGMWTLREDDPRRPASPAEWEPLVSLTDRTATAACQRAEAVPALADTARALRTLAREIAHRAHWATTEHHRRETARGDQERKAA